MESGSSIGGSPNSVQSQMLGKDDEGFMVGSLSGDGDYYPQDELLDSSASFRPKIIVMGLRRSGKTSIRKVVFHKMEPNETLFLESTTRPIKENVNSSALTQLQLVELPAGMHDKQMHSYLADASALLYVIDAQDELQEPLRRLAQVIQIAHKANSFIRLEIFMHKTDGLSDEQKIAVQKHLNQATNDLELSLDLHPSFYLTSIYEYSLFEAVSKVLQKLVPELPTLENLLNIFIANSSIEKAFLFELSSKVYVATDSAPVDMQTYQLCCDMLDLVADLSTIYGGKQQLAAVDPNSDASAAAVIRLNNSTVLYMRGISQQLALVCIIRHDRFEKQGLIDYNFGILKNSITEIIEHKSSLQSEIPVYNTNNDSDSVHSLLQ